MTPNPFIKQYLMTAGPTPLPPKVSTAMAEPILYHRDPAGVELYARVLARLPAVFRTRNDVLLFAASGSGAMEAAVANLVRPGDPVLACSAGKFGERWIELAEAYGARTTRYEPGWGRRLDPAEIDRLLAAEPGIDLVFATLSETSTGIVHDIQAIAEVARAHGAMLAVDAVSGLAAVDVRQDEWGIDVIAAGLAEGAHVPARHRALLGLRPRPRARLLPPRRPLLLRLRDDREEPAPGPAELALHAAGQPAAGDGCRARHDRGGGPRRRPRPPRDPRPGHARRRAGDGPRSLRRPRRSRQRRHRGRAADDIDGGKVPKILRDSYGITANGGQGQLKGRIVRIAHTGYFGAFDIVVSLAGLEMTLAQLGHEVELGAGPGAAQQVFLEAGVAPTPA